MRADALRWGCYLVMLSDRERFCEGLLKVVLANDDDEFHKLGSREI